MAATLKPLLGVLVYQAQVAQPSIQILALSWLVECFATESAGRTVAIACYHDLSICGTGKNEISSLCKGCTRRFGYPQTAITSSAQLQWLDAGATLPAESVGHQGWRPFGEGWEARQSRALALQVLASRSTRKQPPKCHSGLSSGRYQLTSQSLQSDHQARTAQFAVAPTSIICMRTTTGKRHSGSQDCLYLFFHIFTPTAK